MEEIRDVERISKDTQYEHYRRCCDNCGFIYTFTF